MFGFTSQYRLLAAAAATLTLMGLGAGPAAARPDTGPPTTTAVQGDQQCRLERVDQQFTRCDNLTGNGVPAPTWIPER